MGSFERYASSNQDMENQLSDILYKRQKAAEKLAQATAREREEQRKALLRAKYEHATNAAPGVMAGAGLGGTIGMLAGSPQIGAGVGAAVGALGGFKSAYDAEKKKYGRVGGFFRAIGDVLNPQKYAETIMQPGGADLALAAAQPLAQDFRDKKAVADRNKEYSNLPPLEQELAETVFGRNTEGDYITETSPRDPFQRLKYRPRNTPTGV